MDAHRGLQTDAEMRRLVLRRLNQQREVSDVEGTGEFNRRWMSLLRRMCGEVDVGLNHFSTAIPRKLDDVAIMSRFQAARHQSDGAIEVHGVLVVVSIGGRVRLWGDGGKFIVMVMMMVPVRPVRMPVVMMVQKRQVNVRARIVPFTLFPRVSVSNRG